MTAIAQLARAGAKIGRIPQLSLPPVQSCPGASDWCKARCYAKRPYRQYAQTRARWDENYAAVQTGEPLPDLPAGTTEFRFHVSGDFFSAPYIRQWIAFVDRYPNVRFWGYTKSYRVSRLVRALTALRDRPNVQLFASVDESMPEPPAGWRVAYIAPDPRFTGIACPEQAGKVPECASCGFCFRRGTRNVAFTEH